jgi:hypothetical protein
MDLTLLLQILLVLPVDSLVPLAVAALAQQDGAGGAGVFIGVVLFWLGIPIAIIVIYVRRRASFQLETQTTLATEEVLQRAVQTYTMSGWDVTSETADHVTLVRNVRGSCLVTILLGLFLILPAIVYMYFSSHSIHLNVYARRSGASSTTVQIGSTATGWGARAATERLIRDLAPPTGGIAVQDTYEEQVREEDQQPTEETRQRHLARPHLIPTNYNAPHSTLAAVRGTVDLSPEEALDEAESFLTSLGYTEVSRVDNSIWAERRSPANGVGRGTLFLTVTAAPQPGGGVRISVNGNDHEGILKHQAEWTAWSRKLPKESEPQPNRSEEQRTEETTHDLQQQPPMAQTFHFCPNCGHKAQAGHNFCTECGHKLRMELP